MMVDELFAVSSLFSFPLTAPLFVLRVFAFAIDSFRFALSAVSDMTERYHYSTSEDLSPPRWSVYLFPQCGG